MTLKRAIPANRRNAQSSTGPRKRAGKARSGQNARKHGLSAVGLNPRAEAEIERFAELIAGEHRREAAVLESARAVAEAQLQLQRVKTSKMTPIASGPRRSDGARPETPLSHAPDFHAPCRQQRLTCRHECLGQYGVGWPTRGSAYGVDHPIAECDQPRP